MRKKALKKYVWKNNYRGPITADIVGPEVDRIRSEYDKVTPGIVVEEATNESNPIHPCFEWDNDVAGHQHRLQQARKLLNSIEVIEIEIVRSKETEVGRRPMFLHVAPSKEKEEKTGYYELTELVVANVDEWERAMQEAIPRLEGASKIIDLLCDLAPSKGNLKIEKTIRSAKTDLEKAKKKIDEARRIAA